MSASRLPLAQLQHALDHARQERDCEPRPDLAEYWRLRVEQLERQVAGRLQRRAA